MAKAMGYLKRSGVCDGVLVNFADASLVEIGGLGRYVRAETGLDCTFAMKPLELSDKNRAWRDAVVAGARTREVSQLSTDLIAAAWENSHRLLARAVQSMFPDRFVYLGKVTGFYMFRAPRWESIPEGVEEFVRVLNNDVHAAICEAVEELRAKKEIAKESGEGEEENGEGEEENG
jgi:hypothetical protein